MLKTAVDSGRVRDIKSIMADNVFNTDVFLPGFSPANNRGMTLKVLGPVPQIISGKRMLPKIGNTGVTKNGHSIVLLLEIGSIRMLLGGDLNEPITYNIICWSIIQAYHHIQSQQMKKICWSRKLVKSLKWMLQKLVIMAVRMFIQHFCRLQTHWQL